MLRVLGNHFVWFIFKVFFSEKLYSSGVPKTCVVFFATHYIPSLAGLCRLSGGRTILDYFQGKTHFELYSISFCHFGLSELTVIRDVRTDKVICRGRFPSKNEG